MKRVLQGLGGGALAALLMWLALRSVDGPALAAAVRQVTPFPAALAPLALALGYACRIRRWQTMLRPYNEGLGFARAGVAFTASIAVNNLVPLRAGDALRSFGFAPWLGVAPGAVLATVIVERLLDLIVLIVALGAGLWAFSLTGAAMGLAPGVGLGLWALALLGLALVLWPRALRPLFALAERAAPALGPAGAGRLRRFLATMQASLDDLAGRRAMPVLVAWSLAVWLFEGATYWLVALSVPGLANVSAAWLAMPAGTLATLLPSTPGHVGTFDYLAQAAMLAAGNPLIAATLMVLLVHAVLWLSTTLVGSLCLLVWLMARHGLDRGRA